MRNNEERFSASRETVASEAPVVAPASPLNFVVPTEIVSLPSEGRFYPEGHALHMRDHIEIRHMTAKDEDILTSKSLIKKGVAIDRMLQGIIVQPDGLDIDDLLIGDKNALLVAARITGYGAAYNAAVVCPLCIDRVQWGFDLEEKKIRSFSEVLKDLQEPEEKEQEASLLYKNKVLFNEEDMTFRIPLPGLKMYVDCRALNGKDERKLLALAEMRKKKNLPETMLTDQLRMCITGVNGNKDIATVNALIEHMPASDAKHLRSIYALCIPSLDTSQKFECTNCGFEQNMEVPFTVEFFWPR
jgi:hypothetical protein